MFLSGGQLDLTSTPNIVEANRMHRAIVRRFGTGISLLAVNSTYDLVRSMFLRRPSDFEELALRPSGEFRSKALAVDYAPAVTYQPMITLATILLDAIEDADLTQQRRWIPDVVETVTATLSGRSWLSGAWDTELARWTYSATQDLIYHFPQIFGTSSSATDRV